MNGNQDVMKAAAFLAQALDLQDDPHSLSQEIVQLKRDVNAGIFTAELESSVGTAAFLIYVYSLTRSDNDGRTGRELFDAGLTTLQTAAERDAPGPRIMAHALSEDDGFILATSPATYRALTGDAPLETLEANAGNLLPSANTDQARRDAAGELHHLLRTANAQALTWLAALQAEGHLQPEDTSASRLEFTTEETELALYLLDERSIQGLLRVLNLLLTAARQQAEQGLRTGTRPPDG